MKREGFLHMRVSDAEKRILDAIRRDEDDLPNRSDMVRRLITRAGESKGLSADNVDAKRAARR